MLQNIGHNAFLVMSLLVGAAVMLLVGGLYVLWQSYRGAESRRLAQRLKALSAAHDRTNQAVLLKQRVSIEAPRFEKILLAVPRLQGLDKLILQAGLQWSVSRLALTAAFFAAVGWLAVSSGLHQPMWLALACAIAVGSLPILYVLRVRSRRLLKIQTQLPDALDLITRALRSGHAFSPSLQMISEEMSEPIASEFRIVSDEVNFGVSLQQALTHLSDRLPITDLRYFVVAVLIQRDSGGNLTEVLGNLSRLIRERLKLFAKISVLSSEGRLSAWILGVMPFALAGGMYLLNPEFMAPLWLDPIGQAILRTMLIMMAFGLLVLRQIVRIRV